MKRLSAFILIIGATLFSTPSLLAQDTLSIEKVIRTGLEKNFAIRIAENEVRISSNNNSPGNAGFLPVITADGTFNESIEDNVAEYSTNAIPNRNDENARTTVYNYGVNATWTIFDGLSMFATSDRLSYEEEISETEARLQLEQVLADIISTYYQIVGQQNAYHVLENTVEVSQERIRIAETRLDLGSGSKYDLLQSRADLNADRAALIRSGTGLKQAKILLTQVLADTTLSGYDVSDDIVLAEKLRLPPLIEEALQQNSELQIARLNQDAAEAEVREITGEFFPQISLNGGYGYQRTEASSGFADFTETSGFNYGVTARINLFDGMNKSRRRQNAQITKKNQELQLEEVRFRVTSQIRQIYAQYSDALSLIELEEENLQYAQQSQEIALERFRLGTINSVELREAQQSLLNAENRLIAAQIEAKSAETELLRLSGRLLSRSE
ncbi:TolC family protein [Gracilimonas sp.]|uniref:TolC family protein n=1 Tax=Gracilimonas sp. TaxID=1974203 RepID=UPI0032ED849D